MTRRLFVGGNFKSNATFDQGQSLIASFEKVANRSSLDTVIFPVSLFAAGHHQSAQNVDIGLQNVSKYAAGPYTGEITSGQAASAGLNWVLIGHSERRQHFGETNQEVGDKLVEAQQAGLKSVVCIGETGAQREAGETLKVLEDQLNAFTYRVTDWSQLVIAYEPVWAIGTGVVAEPSQAQEAHAFVRKLLGKHGATTTVVYGGSVSGGNCEELIGMPDIDGFLVGGASLKPEFVDIIQAVVKSVP